MQKNRPCLYFGVAASMAGTGNRPFDDDMHPRSGWSNFRVRIQSIHDLLRPWLKNAAAVPAMVEVDPSERVILREDKANARKPMDLIGLDSFFKFAPRCLICY